MANELLVIYGYSILCGVLIGIDISFMTFIGYNMYKQSERRTTIIYNKKDLN